MGTLLGLLVDLLVALDFLQLRLFLVDGRLGSWGRGLDLVDHGARFFEQGQWFFFRCENLDSWLRKHSQWVFLVQGEVGIHAQ